MELLIGFLVGVALGLGFGYENGKEKATAALKKFEAIKAEIIAIEQQADRRIVVEIHKITTRLKNLL